jgi:hypothetical protein
MALGLLLLVAGVVLLVRTLDVPRDERVQALQPHTAADLQHTTNGQEVLIEGHISHATPAGAYDLTAFIYEQQVGEYRPSWRMVEQAQPPLLVQVSDGEVRVAGRYRLVNPPMTHYEQQGEEDYRYRGFAVGSPLLAVGTVQHDAGTTRLESDFIYGGSRAAFLAASERARRLGDSYAPRLMAAGGVLLVASFWLTLALQLVVGVVRGFARLLRRG